MRWTEQDLASRRKGDPGKVRLASELRARTTMPLTWIAQSALERTLSDLVNQACGLIPAEIELLWKTAPPHMPVPPPFLSKGMPE